VQDKEELISMRGTLSLYTNAFFLGYFNQSKQKEMKTHGDIPVPPKHQEPEFGHYHKKSFSKC